MPDLVFHAVGKKFDPRPYLTTSSLKPYSTFLRGDPILSGNKKTHRAGGFKCLVSSRDGDLAGQIEDAILFLKTSHEDLRRLAQLPEVESKHLDFGYYLRIDQKRIFAQSDYLPPELLKLAGELGIGIELSLYPSPAKNQRDESRS
jgi:hypothetical protein